MHTQNDLKLASTEVSEKALPQAFRQVASVPVLCREVGAFSFFGQVTLLHGETATQDAVRNSPSSREGGGCVWGGGGKFRFPGSNLMVTTNLVSVGSVVSGRVCE